MMNQKQQKILYRILLSFALLIVLTILCRMVELPVLLKGILYLIPYLVIGYDILRKAWKGILNHQVFDENFLMAVATVGAFLLGEYAEGSAVMLFYQIGELFQSVAVGKSRQNIADLMDIRPDYANLLRDGQIKKVDPDEVEIGSIIVVNPGEKIPIDGVITEGRTSLDMSALTGESVPRDASVGDPVISGCINLTGALHIETTKEFGESTVSRILDLVENSSMKKARMENFITRFARYYTPAVCYGALALAVLPPLVLTVTGFTGDMGVLQVWSDWITRALTFLVISCPCALVISVPLSFFGGIGCASSKGILVKGSNYLEALANTKYVVFDKTGTLTKGVFEVTQICPAQGYEQQELLKMAVCAESTSGHPISLSLRKAFGQEIALSQATEIEELAGHGVCALVDGRRVLVGNEKLLRRENISFVPRTDAGTLVYVAVDGTYAGCIVISDVVKPSAREAVSSLKNSGVKRTVMLTGDTRSAAEKVAEEAGVDEVKSDLLPADKVTEVEKLLSQKGEKEKLAFVGDGINDAPVLSRADVGIAMGALGSDAAIEAADIVLMDDDPAKIALAMRISVRTLWIVKENIVFALTVKAVCLILGALGIAGMWLAIFADVGVMVLAVLNATRCLRIR